LTAPALARRVEGVPDHRKKQKASEAARDTRTALRAFVSLSQQGPSDARLRSLYAGPGLGPGCFQSVQLVISRRPAYGNQCAR